MSTLLDDFFSKSFENEINDKIFFYSYTFPHQEVCSYLEKIININYSEFIKHIWKHIHIFPISSKDIPQFSSIDNCTINYCKKIAEVDDPGLSFVEIGKLLLNDGKTRNDVAYRKYGENHSKTAFELGLAQVKDNIWFLSCIGHVFLSLSYENQQSILARCILRNRFIAKIIADSENSDVNILKYMHCLSKSTIIRRKSNIMSLINLCNYQITHDQTFQLKKIYFEYNDIKT